MAARREAEQLKERSSVSQAAQQQLLVQLAEAEEALSSSRLTSSRLLHEGQRLEAEVSGLVGVLEIASMLGTRVCAERLCTLLVLLHAGTVNLAGE